MKYILYLVPASFILLKGRLIVYNIACRSIPFVMLITTSSGGLDTSVGAATQGSVCHRDKPVHLQLAIACIN